MEIGGLPTGQMLIYATSDGKATIQVELANESLWLSQALIAELFQTTQQNISVHIANVYDEEELNPELTSRRVVSPRQEGTRVVRRDVTMYNLDLIISVGYRVKSRIATQFRMWATERLVEYIVKGFTMDDERLKEGRSLGQDYFDELLERIRDIRASEKRFYQKVRDIFTLSADYESSSRQTEEFFATVQNKLLFSATGLTAAEIIHSRADRTKENMGLTSWAGTRVRKKDVAVSKNYLAADEIEDLNRLIVMYLDFAELRARRHQPIYMHEWRERLDAFLQFNEREILDNYGSVSMEVAKRLAGEEYDAFDALRRGQEAIDEDVADLTAIEELVSKAEQDRS